MNEKKFNIDPETVFTTIGIGLIAGSLAVCGGRKAKALLWVGAAESTVLLMKHGYEKYVKKGEENEDLGDQFVQSKVVY